MWHIKGMSNICISITSIPSRINDIIPTLNSFQDQKGIKKIFICIPKFSIRFQREYILSDSLKRYIESKDLIQLIWCPDYGPGTKLLGCLDHVDISDNILICDDDRKLKPDVIFRFSEMITLYPNTILCGKYTNQNNSQNKVLWRCCGILIPKRLVDDDIYKIHYAMSCSCRYVDDVFWTRYFVDYKKYEPVVVKGISVSSEHCGQDALYKETGSLQRHTLQTKCESCELPNHEELSKLSDNPYVLYT